MFTLTEDEQRQIKYLVDLIKPFCFFTNTIRRTKGLTLGHVYSIYNQLFNHLEHFLLTLQAKRQQGNRPQINCIVEGINKALLKLQKYY